MLYGNRCENMGEVLDSLENLNVEKASMVKYLSYRRPYDMLLSWDSKFVGRATLLANNAKGTGIVHDMMKRAYIRGIVLAKTVGEEQDKLLRYINEGNVDKVGWEIPLDNKDGVLYYLYGQWYVLCYHDDHYSLWRLEDVNFEAYNLASARPPYTHSS